MVFGWRAKCDEVPNCACATSGSNDSAVGGRFAKGVRHEGSGLHRSQVAALALSSGLRMFASAACCCSAVHHWRSRRPAASCTGQCAAFRRVRRPRTSLCYNDAMRRCDGLCGLKNRSWRSCAREKEVPAGPHGGLRRHGPDVFTCACATSFAPASERATSFDDK